MATGVPSTSMENVVCHSPTIDGLTANAFAGSGPGVCGGEVESLPDSAAAAAAGRSESPHDARAVPLAPEIKIAVQRPILPSARASICFLLCGRPLLSDDIHRLPCLHRH